MKVDLDQIKPGCILVQDVIGKTNKPLISKDTVLTEEHINMLKAFLIDTVYVSPTLSSGEPFIALNSINNTKSFIPLNSTFEEQYMNVVDQFEVMFKSWQKNLPVDIPEIRKIVVPLLTQINKFKSDIYILPSLVTPEKYLYHHSIAVGLLSALLAKKMNYLEHEWIQIGLAGVLSDVGMSKVDPSILLKSNGLTSWEVEEVNAHPLYSYRLIEESPLLTKASKIAILQHHERRNGSGYPLGLTDNTIQPYAQIIAVCDIYHAMVCNRHFQGGISPFLALEQLGSDRFTSLDPNVVQTFLTSIASFSIGMKVKLSNGLEGEIVFIEENNPTKPMVRLMKDNTIITLEDEHGLYIQDIL